VKGATFGRPQQHQTLIRAKRDRFCINGKTSSGSLLPIVSMMQSSRAGLLQGAVRSPISLGRAAVVLKFAGE
jgi:hypothetical protein